MHSAGAIRLVVTCPPSKRRLKSGYATRETEIIKSLFKAMGIAILERYLSDSEVNRDASDLL